MSIFIVLELVWKVARYTSAAPLFFSEMDHYVDGAVLANNPCEYALTAINNFYRSVFLLCVKDQQKNYILKLYVHTIRIVKALHIKVLTQAPQSIYYA